MADESYVKQPQAPAAPAPPPPLTPTVSLESVRTGVQFTSEMLLPGGSNLIKGDLKQGGIHVALGLAARAFLGLPAMLLISANSFTKAMTGHHLHEHLHLLTTQAGKPAAPDAPDATPQT